jgi:hypothetical protein
MPRNKKPGDPWNQFSKKKPAGKLAKRTPKPDVKPSKALPGGKAAKALPPAKSNSPSMSGGAKPKSTAAKPTPKSLPPGKPGGALTKAVRGASGLRRGVGAALLTGMVAKAGDTLTKAANPKEWERVQRELKERQANYKAPTKAERTAGTRRNAAGTRKTTGGNNAKPAVGNIPTSEGTGGKAETTLKYGKATPKPSPAPAASRPSTPAPARRSGSTSSTPKPAPKPAGKVPSGERRVSASTANRESGNYGTSRTNNPLMKGMTDRMRQREERDGVGPVKDGNRYAADMKNTTKGVGPVASGERYASGMKSGMPKNEQVKAKAPAPRTASKPRQRPGTGRDDMLSRYMDERKRRQNGQSRLIG